MCLIFTPARELCIQVPSHRILAVFHFLVADRCAYSSSSVCLIFTPARELCIQVPNRRILAVFHIFSWTIDAQTALAQGPCFDASQEASGRAAFD